MTVTNQRLTWILTEYGKNRINQLLINPDDKIRISTMHLGSDSTGTPQERETEDGTGRLKHEVAIGIPIVEKGLDADRENTVYFKALINENKCGYDIAELAIYEEINGVEKMFAVGVGQAMPKPDIKYGYLMSIEYKLYIESTNLLVVYDQIELDPDNEYLKQSDVDDLYKTVLYVEGNMAEQIGRNTHQIGLGRAKELNDLISDTQLRYNSASVSSYYSSMANSIDDLKNIIGFWSFNYTNSYGTKMNIKDFSSWDNYFSTNSLLSSYEQNYLGVLSSLNFTEDDFFYIDAVPQATSSSNLIQLGHLVDHTLTGHMTYSDTNHDWIYNGTHISISDVKSNYFKYYLKAQIAYVTHTTNTTNPIVLGDIGNACYGPLVWKYESTSAHGEESGKWICDEINATYDIPTFKSKIVTYTNIASDGDIIRTYQKGATATPSSSVITITSVISTSPAPSVWTYNSEDDNWTWLISTASQEYFIYSSEDFKTKVADYTGTPTDGMTITMAEAPLTYTVVVTFTGRQLDLIKYVTDASTAITTVKDSPFTFIASLKHNEMGERNTILAQASNFTHKYNFEIAKTDTDALELTLYGSIGTVEGVSQVQYIKFTTNNNAVPSSAYNLVITYNPNYRTVAGRELMEPECRMYINNKKCTVTKTTLGTYSGMQENSIQTTSYIDDTNKNKTYPINAQVCLMALIKEEFDAQVARCNSLVLNSLAGRNVYYRV